MKNSSLLRALPILAIAFSNKSNVSLGIGGNQAWSNGKHIQLPSLPLDASERLETLAIGYLCHEAGHIEFTVPAEWEPTPFQNRLRNAIEDVRMEACRIKKYAGSADSIAKLVELLDQEGSFLKGKDLDQVALPQLVLFGVLMRGRAEVLQQPVKESADALAVALEKRLPSAAWVKLQVLGAQIEDLASNQECADLALRICEMLEESTKPAANGEPNAVTEGEPDAVTEGAPDAVSEEQREQIRAMLDASEDELPKVDIGDVVSGQLSKSAEKEVEEQGGFFGPQDVTTAPTSERSELSSVLDTSQVLRTRLAASMQVEQQRGVHHARQGHRLDTRKIARLFTDDGRAFRIPSRRRFVDTAVQLLVDVSDSMSGTPVEIARQATLACAVGMEQIRGVKCAAAAFPAIQVLKRFDERARQVASRFVIDADGSTPMAQAMLWAGASLLARRELRKILLVITDGAPDAKSPVQQLVKRFAASHVECIGVGIQDCSVRDLFPRHIVIDSVAELGTTLFSVINQRLRAA